MQSAAAADAPDCASVRELHNWDIKSRRIAFVRVPEGQRFKVTVMWQCLSTFPLGVRVEARGACLARGNHVFVTCLDENSNSTEQRCLISAVEAPTASRH
jgi:hypothetical protein